MAHIYAVGGIVPVVDGSAFVSASAMIIGDVIVGAACYVGPSASLRGDFGRLILRNGSNVQDCCVVHGGHLTDTLVGENAIIAHGAVLHGCEIRANALVGINSVVLDAAVVGEQALVAAMSFVPSGFVIPPRTLAMGIPVRIVRDLTAAEVEFLVVGARAYRDLTGPRLCEVHHPLRALTPERLAQRNPPIDSA